jgi:hypothetical protein
MKITSSCLSLLAVSIVIVTFSCHFLEAIHLMVVTAFRISILVVSLVIITYSGLSLLAILIIAAIYSYFPFSNFLDDDTSSFLSLLAFILWSSRLLVFHLSYFDS